MLRLNSLGRHLKLTAVAFAAGATLLAGAANAESKGTVHLAYVEWSSTVASTNVVRVLLEQAGYDVKTTSLAAAAMWQSVASGDADALLAGWLPTTHEDYYNELKDDIDDLGVNLDGTKLGLVVPEYTDIDSIEDINANADSVNNEIIGIDPGAGLQRLTGEVVKEYDLDVRLRDGTDATMTAALGNAIDNEEDIIVTGWTPHWMFARWDLKYLDDPKGVYGGAEQIHTIARQGLEDDMPEAYEILKNFHWTSDDMGEVMLMNEQGDGEPYDNAKKWVEDNADKVNEWLGK